MTQIPDYQPEPVARGLVIGCLLAAGLVVGVVLWSAWMPGWDADERAQLNSGLDFPQLHIDAVELETARTDFAGETNLELIEDEVQQLEDVVRQANRAQFSRDATDIDDTGEQLRQQLMFLSNDVATATGPRGFQQAGGTIIDACQSSLEDLLGEVRAGNLPMEQAIDDPPQQRFESYRANCGNYLPVLHHRGLVDDDGQWTRSSAPELAEILQRYRWVHDLQGDKYSIHMLMSPQELEVFYRWRIEDGDAFDADQRLSYLHSALPLLPDDYDAPLAEARIKASQEESDREKRRHFQELIDDYPENDLYRAIYDDAF